MYNLQYVQQSRDRQLAWEIATASRKLEISHVAHQFFPCCNLQLKNMNTHSI